MRRPDRLALANSERCLDRMMSSPNVRGRAVAQGLEISCRRRARSDWFKNPPACRTCKLRGAVSRQGQAPTSGKAPPSRSGSTECGVGPRLVDRHQGRVSLRFKPDYPILNARSSPAWSTARSKRRLAATLAIPPRMTARGERLGKRPSYVAKCEGGDRRLDLLEFLDVAAVINRTDRREG